MGKHTHFSFVTALGIFLVVLVFGTVWRAGSARLAASDRIELQRLGAAMYFQF